MLAIDPISIAEGVVADTEGLIGDVEGLVSDVEGGVNIATTTATSTATQLQHYALTMWDYMKQMAMFSKQQATTLASTSANFAKQKAIQAENRLGQVAMNVKNEAKTIYREGVTAAKLTKTLKFIYKMIKKVWPVLKWGFIFVKMMNGLGVWSLRAMEVAIYRLFHMKDCFLWYTLEIIGFILYVPIEFFVWLFCLKSLEDSLWKLLEDLDCFLTGILGFHVFHYSDTILKKCYSKRFPPLPFKSVDYEGDGEFTEKEFVKFVVDWFLPPSPEEIGQAVNETVQLMKENPGAIDTAAGVVKDEIAGLFKITPPDPKEAEQLLGDIFKF
jgi:hypothetical protein